MSETDRPALCRMLEESSDFPASAMSAYEGRNSRYRDFVASYRGTFVGVLSGSVDSDFFESGAFDSFALPPPPHAFLSRLHVTDLFRQRGAGRALVDAYGEYVEAAGCTFVGGSVDLSSPSEDRRIFFERCGFTIRDLDNFGAAIGDLRAHRRG